MLYRQGYYIANVDYRELWLASDLLRTFQLPVQSHN